MKMYAVLDENRNVVVVDSYEDTYAYWTDHSKRRVGRDELPNGIVISTVFLCINHGFGGGDLWFETLITGGPDDGCIYRYATWKEAECGHRKHKNKWVRWKPPVNEHWAATHDANTLTILKKKPGWVRKLWYWFTGKKIVKVSFPEQEL